MARARETQTLESNEDNEFRNHTQLSQGTLRDAYASATKNNKIGASLRTNDPPRQAQVPILYHYPTQTSCHAGWGAQVK